MYSFMPLPYPRGCWLCALFNVAMLEALRTPMLPRMAVTPGSKFAIYGFDADQMDALVRRGELEAALMREALPLEAPAVEAPTANGGALAKGSGAKKGRNKALKPTSIQARSRQALLDDGVVRINNVLSAATAGRLRSELLIRRDKAYAAIEDEGADWREDFADVLLKSNRCDLLLPLKGSPTVQRALRELLFGTAAAPRNLESTGRRRGNGSSSSSSSSSTSTVSSSSSSSTLYAVLCAAFGEDAILYELAALISTPGAPRQPVHPDNPHQDQPPLLTCFVALQVLSRRASDGLSAVMASDGVPAVMADLMAGLPSFPPLAPSICSPLSLISPHLPSPLRLLSTCFVALQPINATMGATLFLPRTHTAQAHAAFGGGGSGGQMTISSRDAMLRDCESSVALLGTGDAVLFDSRTMHCGGKNEVVEQGGATRALFCMRRG